MLTHKPSRATSTRKETAAQRELDVEKELADAQWRYEHRSRQQRALEADSEEFAKSHFLGRPNEGYPRRRKGYKPQAPLYRRENDLMRWHDTWSAKH